MAQLGGGGPQTLWGYALACPDHQPRLGLAAGVGDDLPPHATAWLVDLGCDLSGLLAHPDLPTPRAWQVMEADGRRTQVWRSPECDGLYQQLRPTFDQLPASFQSSRNYHLGIHAGHAPMSLLAALRDAAHAQGGILSVETYTACEVPPPARELRALLEAVDVFSPNEGEGASLVGPGRPEQLAARLLDAGAGVVALRRGEQGALVASASMADDAWEVPAVRGTRVVDVVGCGNAFCGAFLAQLDAQRRQAASAAGGSVRGGTARHDLGAAAAWGCIAGSLMAEWQGVPQLSPRDLRREAAARLEQIRPLARRVAVARAAAGGLRAMRVVQR